MKIRKFLRVICKNCITATKKLSRITGPPSYGANSTTWPDKALEDNRAAFVADVGRFGMRLAEDFKVVPLIVLSTSTHVGTAASTVPVIDEDLLGRYLDSSLSDYAYHPSGPASSARSQLVSYANTAEAEARAADYFARPPHSSAASRSPRSAPVCPPLMIFRSAM
ncbi:MAG TPA: hypothetical protein VLC71_08240 [Thermomonas sp.]|nr:hypothetical protein [Thermomonas sp.]